MAMYLTATNMRLLSDPQYHEGREGVLPNFTFAAAEMFPNYKGNSMKMQCICKNVELIKRLKLKKGSLVDLQGSFSIYEHKEQMFLDFEVFCVNFVKGIPQKEAPSEEAKKRIEEKRNALVRLLEQEPFA